MLCFCCIIDLINHRLLVAVPSICFLCDLANILLSIPEDFDGLFLSVLYSLPSPPSTGIKHRPEPSDSQRLSG